MLSWSDGLSRMQLPKSMTVAPLREVADVVALLAEVRLQVLEPAARGEELLDRRARTRDASVYADRVRRDAPDGLVRLVVDVADVLVVRYAIRLLHDERARRGAHVRHELHGTDVEHGGSVHRRMLVMHPAEADVLRLDGEVELLEDALVAHLERLFHRRHVMVDDLVEDRLFAQNGGVDVGPQHLDDAVLARHGAVLGLDVAEKRLAHRRRAEHLLDLDGKDFAVRAVDEFQELRLDGLDRNRREARLHVLEGELRLGVEGADRQALKHLLEKRPRALQELRHLLGVGGVVVGVPDHRREHLELDGLALERDGFRLRVGLPDRGQGVAEIADLRLGKFRLGELDLAGDDVDDVLVSGLDYVPSLVLVGLAEAYEVGERHRLDVLARDALDVLGERIEVVVVFGGEMHEGEQAHARLRPLLPVCEREVRGRDAGLSEQFDDLQRFVRTETLYREIPELCEPSCNPVARRAGFPELGLVVVGKHNVGLPRKSRSSIFERSMPRKANASSRARSRRKLARLALPWDAMFRTSFANSAISLRIPSVRAS